MERCSQPRYALDRRFVRLTLLIDQGPDASGPRWEERRQFQDLNDLLNDVTEPAIVLLGPPGCGKSTLLRHYELENCQKGLANTGAEQPLTFFIPLNDYKPKDNNLPPPMDWLAERWQALDPQLPPLRTCYGKGG